MRGLKVYAQRGETRRVMTRGDYFHCKSWMDRNTVPSNHNSNVRVNKYVNDGCIYYPSFR